MTIRDLIKGSDVKGKRGHLFLCIQKHEIMFMFRGTSNSRTLFNTVN